MEISHPRRILAVSLPESGLLELVKELTGTVPSLTVDSVAGTTHNWDVQTAYYTASVPIWLDEILEPHVWSSEFLAPEAREVLNVLGAFVVCFRKPINDAGLSEIKTLLHNVAQVVKEGCGYSWDGVCLAVAMPQSTKPYLQKNFEEWEVLCQDFGFEFVDFESKGRNEYSEPIGMERLKEALEANEWEGVEKLGGVISIDDLDEDEDEEEGSLSFGIEAGEMENGIFGMKQAINRDGADGAGGVGCASEIVDELEGDQEIEQLQAMMLRLQAVRGNMGPDLPDSERRKLAARTVNEIMRRL